MERKIKFSGRKKNRIIWRNIKNKHCFRENGICGVCIFSIFLVGGPRQIQLKDWIIFSVFFYLLLVNGFKASLTYKIDCWIWAYLRTSSVFLFLLLCLIPCIIRLWFVEKLPHPKGQIVANVAYTPTHWHFMK